MKSRSLLFVVLSALLLCPALFAETITEQQVIDLVASTAAELTGNATATFEKINKGEAPYKSTTDPEFYVFVYDQDVNMLAHPTASLVGKNFKGKPDAKGKKFRDEIIEGALKNKTGWIEYMYQKPGDSGLHPKKVYYQLVTTAEGKQYIVCSGMYLPK